mmetsp:Transcript_158359/g.303885  ORF Transcript_158359/g.303885 Transcript_158359/m.303885 type:complete len:236 (-) Transcript_158359:65-772(-)
MLRFGLVCRALHREVPGRMFSIAQPPVRSTTLKFGTVFGALEKELPRRTFCTAQQTVQPGTNIVQRYRSFSLAYPFTAAFGICAAKGFLADAFAQKVIERKPGFEPRRAIAMTLFSGSYCGCAQHFVFNVAFTRIFGTCTKLPTAMKKMVADFSGHAPFMYMPTYFAFDELLRFGTLAGLWERYKEDLPKTMKEYLKVWPAVMMCLFTVVPVELRITVLAAVSFVWLIILSVTAH